jgi:hypothetical protein
MLKKLGFQGESVREVEKGIHGQKDVVRQVRPGPLDWLAKSVMWRPPQFLALSYDTSEKARKNR